MKEFKSIDKFRITGRGEVITVKLEDTENVVGQTVLIDGEEYKVRGVESMGKIKVGSFVGLLV